MFEQTCALLRCAPGRAASVLRGDASVSLVADGGAALDSEARARPLLQLFAIRVDGLEGADLRANAAALRCNLAAAGAPPSVPWLERDDLTWAPVDGIGQPHGREALVDCQVRWFWENLYRS